jgi:methyl-accepting chemotaxis protein
VSKLEDPRGRGGGPLLLLVLESIAWGLALGVFVVWMRLAGAGIVVLLLARGVFVLVFVLVGRASGWLVRWLAPIYGASWFVTLAVIVLLAWARVGADELLGGMLVAFGVGLGAAGLIRPACEGWLVTSRSRLAERSLEREGAVVDHAIAGRLRVFVLCALAGVVLVMAGVDLLARVDAGLQPSLAFAALKLALALALSLGLASLAIGRIAAAIEVPIAARTDSLRARLHATVDELDAAVTAAHAERREVAAVVREIATALTRASTDIQQTIRAQGDAVEQHSQKALEFGELVSRLTSSTSDIEVVAGEVLANAEQAQATTQAMATAIAGLDAEAGQIGELLELVRDIADRSDILALNGALEATRAGEAGRGFALVADEMRRLAERITGVLGTVRERIANIRAAADDAVAATERSRALAADTASASRRISAVTSSQNEEAKVVSDKVLEVANLVTSTVWTMNQTEAVNEELLRRVATLEQLAAGFDAPDRDRVTS